jgi:hypothetical protein
MNQANRPDANTPVHIAPAPLDESLADQYLLTVNGHAVPVYACRVSAIPFNQVWPGYQRPLDQTELAGFAYWDMAGGADIEIRPTDTVESVAVRPLSLGIVPNVTEGCIRFHLDQPHHAVVEVNGEHHALHLLVSPPEQGIPDPNAPGVLTFGPGVHEPGLLYLESHTTVYLAPGAVVYGGIQARGREDIRIRGRGILDGSRLARGEGSTLSLTDCQDVTIEGIVLRDPSAWCCSLFGCRNATIADLKLVGLWRYNADGIDICNCENLTVRDCFVRAYDDNIVIKGLKQVGHLPVHNVRVSGCTLWNDWGRALEIGAETCAPEMDDIEFSDCDIIHTVHIAMDIQHGDRAAVSGVCFRDIRVETDGENAPPKMQQSPEDRYAPAAGETHLPRLLVVHITGTNYSQDRERGTVRQVRFEDISVVGSQLPTSILRGFDADHEVADVTIENLRHNTQPLDSLAEARIEVGPHVRDLVFVPPMAD